MRNLFFILLLLSSYQAIAQERQGSKLVAKGASPVLIASDFLFTEGPARDAEGNVFFTDQPNNRILGWSPTSGIWVFMENAGRSNGLYFDQRGNLLACADEKNELWSISADKKIEVLVSDFNGKQLNGPNDLWVDPNGGIYFTDPFYKRDYWTRTEKEIPGENVYYLSPDRKKLVMVMDGFVSPNGIVGTPDGKTLYVADIGDGKTYAFKVNSDGSLAGRRLFVSMGSDGMTIDSKGNVYLTGKGVTIFDPSGTQIGHVPIDEPWTANVCFGGKDRRTLFITASKSVYTLAMRVRGASQ
jgi:gluconolactonase